MNEDKCEISESLKASPPLAHQGSALPMPINLGVGQGEQLHDLTKHAVPSLVPLGVPPSSLAFPATPPST